MRGWGRVAVVAALFALGPAASAAAPEELERLYLEAVRLMEAGRHEDATAAFERLIELEPQHAGARLELAISHCTLGHPSEAEKMFRDIEVRFAPSAGILDVINAHRKTGCKPWQARSYRGATLSRGSDSNVNQGASNPVFVSGSGPERIESLLSDDFLPKRDGYTQAAFDYTRELNRHGAIGFAQLRSRRYDNLQSQDTNAVLLGVDRPLRGTGWPTSTSASGSLVSLGGKVYQRQLQLQARTMPAVSLIRPLDLTLSAALGRVEYVSRKAFNANSAELGAMLGYRGRHTLGQVAAGALFEQGHPNRPGGDRRGGYASAQLQRQFNGDYAGEVSLTRQDWHSAGVYSPGLIDVVRRQSTRQVRAAVTRALGPQHSLQLEWRHVRNHENISLFQYNSEVVQLNWRWSGF